MPELTAEEREKFLASVDKFVEEDAKPIFSFDSRSILKAMNVRFRKTGQRMYEGVDYGPRGDMQIKRIKTQRAKNKVAKQSRKKNR